MKVHIMRARVDQTEMSGEKKRNALAVVKKDISNQIMSVHIDPKNRLPKADREKEKEKEKAKEKVGEYGATGSQKRKPATRGR